MQLRDQLMRSAHVPLSPTTRLPMHYPLELANGRTLCDACQVRLHQRRTATRHPVGLSLGQPRVRLVQKRCPLCGRLYGAESYPDWVPRHGNYAFDVIVEVGLARFLRHCQNGEIQQQLETGLGLRLSGSTISELAQSFLDCLAATHQAHSAQLRERLQQDGGYVLHVDGTCEAGTAIVFNAVAANRGWSLAGCKMATEDTSQIQRLLQHCVEWFGRPLALVRDLSAQIEAAHQQCMPDIPDLICHYHFLENVGTKLCQKHHAQLVACLRRLKTRPTLGSLRHDLVRHTKQQGPLTPAQIEQLLAASDQAADLDPTQRRRALCYLLLRWLEDYGADLEGKYFPFDLPSLALYRRYCEAHTQLAQSMPVTNPPRRALSTPETILHHLTIVAHDPELTAAAARLEKAVALFNELRQVLRLDSDGRHPLSHQRPAPDGPLAARQREEHLQQWIRQLHHRRDSESDPERAADYTIVLDYLDKYDGKLTGHVIVLPDRPEPFVVQRTNNISEHRFAKTKQGLRRKLGIKNLARYVQAMRPEEFLVDNLHDPDYLQIVCGGSLDKLAASLAQNWQAAQQIRAQRRAKTINHPIPAKRKILRQEGFLAKLTLVMVNQNTTTKGVAA